MEKTLQELKANKSNVYIKINDQYMLDRTSFFYLDEENMILTEVYIFKKNEKEEIKK